MDSAEEEVEHNNSEMGFQENGQQVSYGLRENPKKSWKFSGFNHESASSMQENQCKVCGKSFESLKALFGHMRHHSKKGKTRTPCKHCGKTFLSLKALANHSRFHSEKSRHDLAVKKKRSGRKRYNLCTSSSISSLNESSSVTEIDQEVEQAARCLMMLSRGVPNWGGLNPFAEFSDNDFVAFEVEPLKNLSCVSESLIVLYEKRENTFGELCSGIESFEKNKIELEVSIEKFYKGGGEFGMQKVDDFIEKGIRIESSEDLMGEVEFGRDFSNNVTCTTCDCKFKCEACNRMFRSRRALAGHGRMHGTKKKGELMKPECPENSMEKIKGRLGESRKHECPICFRDFATVQALGGHKRVHMAKNIKSRPRKTLVMKQENSELDLDISIMASEEDNGATMIGFEPVTASLVGQLN